MDTICSGATISYLFHEKCFTLTEQWLISTLCLNISIEYMRLDIPQQKWEGILFGFLRFCFRTNSCVPVSFRMLLLLFIIIHQLAMLSLSFCQISYFKSGKAICRSCLYCCFCRKGFWIYRVVIWALSLKFHCVKDASWVSVTLLLLLVLKAHHPFRLFYVGSTMLHFVHPIPYQFFQADIRQSSLSRIPFHKTVLRI